MSRMVIALIAVVAVVAVVSGCSGGRPPFRMVQLCLADRQEVSVFVAFMRTIARSHGMELVDRSVDTAAELRALPDIPFRIADPLVNIGADHDGEFSFGAGNMGLPTRQMAIGFNGHDANAAHRVADAIVARLSTRWRVYEVPRHAGARPLPDCS